MNSKTKLLSFELNKPGITKSGKSIKPGTVYSQSNFDGLIQGFQLTKTQQNLLGMNQIGEGAVKTKKIFIPINNVKQSNKNLKEKIIKGLNENKSDIVSVNENNMVMRSLIIVEKNKKSKKSVKIKDADAFNVRSTLSKNNSTKINKPDRNNLSNTKNLPNSPKLGGLVENKPVEGSDLKKQPKLRNQNNTKINFGDTKQTLTPEVVKTFAVKSGKAEASVKSQSAQNPVALKSPSGQAVKIETKSLSGQAAKTEIKSAAKSGNLANTKINFGDTKQTLMPEVVKTFAVKSGKAEASVKSQSAQNPVTLKSPSGQAAKTEVNSTAKSGNLVNTKINIGDTKQTLTPEVVKTFAVKSGKTEASIKSQSAQDRVTLKSPSGQAVKIETKSLSGQAAKTEVNSTAKSGNLANTKINFGDTKQTLTPEVVKTFAVKSGKAEASVKSQSAQNLVGLKSPSRQAAKTEVNSTAKSGNLANTKINIGDTKQTLAPEVVKTFAVKSGKAEASVKSQSAQDRVTLKSPSGQAVKIETKSLSGQAAKTEVNSTAKSGNLANTKINFSDTKQTLTPEVVKTFSVKSGKAEASIKSQSAQNRVTLKSPSGQAVKIETKSLSGQAAKTEVNSTIKSGNLVNTKINFGDTKQTLTPEVVKTFAVKSGKSEASVKSQSAQNRVTLKSPSGQAVKIETKSLSGQAAKTEIKSAAKSGNLANTKINFGDTKQTLMPEVVKTFAVKSGKAEASIKSQSAQNRVTLKSPSGQAVKIETKSLSGQAAKTEVNSTIKSGNLVNTKINFGDTKQTLTPEVVKTFAVKSGKAEASVKSQSVQNPVGLKSPSGQAVKIETKSLSGQAAKTEVNSTAKSGHLANTKINFGDTKQTLTPEVVKTFAVKSGKAEASAKSQSAQNSVGLKSLSGQAAKTEVNSKVKSGNLANTKINFGDTKQTLTPEVVKTFAVKSGKTEASVKSQSAQNRVALKSPSGQAVKIETKSLSGQAAKTEVNSKVKSGNLANTKINYGDTNKTVKPEITKIFGVKSGQNNSSIKKRAERNNESVKSTMTLPVDQKDNKNIRKPEMNTEKLIQKSDAGPEWQTGKGSSLKPLQKVLVKDSELVKNEDGRNEKNEGSKQDISSEKSRVPTKKISKVDVTENSRSNTHSETKTFKGTIETQKSRSNINAAKPDESRADDGSKNETLKENQNTFKSQTIKNTANFKAINAESQNKGINSDKTVNIQQTENAGMPVSTILDSPKSLSIKTTIQQIVHVISAQKGGKNSITGFKIDGGDLGQLEIKFTKNGDSDGAKIIVMSDMTRSVIQKMLPTIQGELVEKGINLASLDVEVDHSAQNEKNEEARSKKENKQSVISNIFENEDDTNPKQKIKDYGYNTMEVIA